jgi:hypothetical protein
VFDRDSDLEASAANPVVFHMHGHYDIPESMVLSEDDYLDFLVNVSRDQGLVPPRIQEAMAGTSLLFIGYSLADWNFRVIFRGLVGSLEGGLRRINVAVQLPPVGEEQELLEVQQKYLSEYFGTIKVYVYWGHAKDFVKDLRKRWKDFA